MNARPDILMPPEGVPLTFPVAGFGVRVAAQIVDILITGFAAVALLVILGMTKAVGFQWLFALGSALFFFIRVPYYVLSELAWNGQTLGKRFMKIKVVANDGGPLTTHALVLRNLMKEAEIFLPATLVLALDAEELVPSLIALAWTLATILVMVLNKRRRRLGDLMAGTYVIHLPVPVLLKDLASERPAEDKAKKDRFGFLTHHLDHYGTYELQTLETVLRASERSYRSPAEMRQRTKTLDAIVEKIRTKIDYAEPVPPDARLAFLRAFYNAQRAHLEQKQLFGEVRADKHHGADQRDD